MSTPLANSYGIAMNGTAFSAAGPLIVPHMAASGAEHSFAADGFHRAPEGILSFIMMALARHVPRFETRWGCAYVDRDECAVTIDVPSFGPYVDDALHLVIEQTLHGGNVGMEASLWYDGPHFTVEQRSYMRDFTRWTSGKRGITAISIRISAELIINAMTRMNCQTSESHRDVQRAIIEPAGSVALRSALTSGLAFGGDFVVKGGDAKTDPRLVRMHATDTMLGYSRDDEGLYLDPEAPRFSIAHIAPEDPEAPRGSPARRQYVEIVQNAAFDHTGLLAPFSPLVVDLMHAAAAMRPGMFPLDDR